MDLITLENIDGVIFKHGSVYYCVDMVANKLYTNHKNDDFNDLKQFSKTEMGSSWPASYLQNINSGKYKYIRHFNKQKSYELWI